MGVGVGFQLTNGIRWAQSDGGQMEVRADTGLRAGAHRVLHVLYVRDLELQGLPLRLRASLGLRRRQNLLVGWLFDFLRQGQCNAVRLLLLPGQDGPRRQPHGCSCQSWSGNHGPVMGLGLRSLSRARGLPDVADLAGRQVRLLHEGCGPLLCRLLRRRRWRATYRLHVELSTTSPLIRPLSPLGAYLEKV